jgi:hypothetical protein
MPCAENIKVSTDLLGLVDPQGNIVHTKLGLVQAEIIEDWLDEERTMNIFTNHGRRKREENPSCARSWESYEAEGYRIIPVKIVPNL